MKNQVYDKDEGLLAILTSVDFAAALAVNIL